MAPNRTHALRRSAPSPKPPVDPPALTVIVSSQASAGLRLRDQPSSNGNILEVLMPGTSMTVLGPAPPPVPRSGSSTPG